MSDTKKNENRELSREDELISIAWKLSEIPMLYYDWSNREGTHYTKELFDYAYDLHKKNCEIEDVFKVFKDKYPQFYINALEVVLFLLDAWQNKNYLKFYSRFIELKFEKNVGEIFYGKDEYEAFRYIVNELYRDQKKVLFKILWSMYNKILIKCKGEIWDEWVYKEFFPNEKVSPIAGKFNGNTGNKLYQKVLRISKQYPDQKVFEYS